MSSHIQRPTNWGHHFYHSKVDRDLTHDRQIHTQTQKSLRAYSLMSFSEKTGKSNHEGISRQKFVYQFKGDQCEAGYVGCTSQHLHQCIKEHEGKTTIGKHMQTHGNDTINFSNHFNVCTYAASNTVRCATIFSFFLLYDQGIKCFVISRVLNLELLTMASVFLKFYHSACRSNPLFGFSSFLPSEINDVQPCIRLIQYSKCCILFAIH